MNDVEENNLVSSVSRYLRFCKNLDSKSYILHGFPINYLSFDFNNLIKNSLNNLSDIITFLKDGKHLTFYSLQNDIEAGKARIDWNKFTLDFFINIQKDGNFYIFLYDSGSYESTKDNSYFKNHNSTDAEFCHSMLFRDFVKYKRIGFEIDLAVQDTKKENNFKDYLSEKKSKLNTIYAGKKDYDFKNIQNEIINSFLSYFKAFKWCKKTFQGKYQQYLTDFYAFNVNCKAFKGIDGNEIIIDNIKMSEVDSGHELYGSVINKLKSGDDSGISDLSKWLVFVNILSSLTKLIVHHCNANNELKLLILDDHPEKIEEEIKIIEYWLGKDSIMNKNNELVPKDEIDSYFGNIKIDQSLLKIGLNNCKKTYDFIIIDLDYEGELKGFDYLRKLRAAKSIYDPPYVIVFSRNEDSASIQKALNMGALFFASKQNFGHLLLEIYKVLPLIRKMKENSDAKDSDNVFSLGENWTLLYQLPLAKILELKSSKIDIKDLYTTFEESENNVGFDSNKIESSKDYLWIKRLPKAELHNHIGSVLGPQLIPKTSLIVLSNYYKKFNDNDAEKRINAILDFIIPIASDPYLFESEDNKRYGSFKKKLKTGVYGKKWFKLKRVLASDYDNQFYNQSIFTIITDSLNLQSHNKTPEEVLLSPQDQILEKHFKPFSRLNNSEYYKQKMLLRKLEINYEEVILFFVLLLYMREELLKNKKTKIEDVIKALISTIKVVFEDYKIFIAKVNDSKTNDYSFPQEEINTFKDKFSECISNYSRELTIPFKNPIPDKTILEFLISAHSKERCLPYENRGLFNYLRGCEYGGAPHLQCKESIFLAAHHIIFNYAIPDNIRYLDLRCAIDGYNKFKLFDVKEKKAKRSPFDEIVDVLKTSFNCWQRYALLKKKQKVHVNLIVTAKRHKSIKEFEKNVELTIDNYILHKNSDFKNEKSFFEQTNTEIVSFDIAGLEKNNRVSKFKDQIKPLLDKCVPITMHAGEEDSHESIWEAFYLAHAQRLGHALTLLDNDELKNLVRESFVNIELCPISNYLTNNKYMFNLKGSIDEYPLRNYLEERLSVSINTDNPYVSDSTLTKEFLFASKIYGGLTRWQVLKLILYSFKSITIHKNLKSILMKEINEEIFKLLLEEDQ